MRRLLPIAVVIAVLGPLLPGTATAAKRSGIEGVVLNSTCFGPCVEPQPQAPAYTGGDVTVQVRRASDGVLVASKTPGTDGRFRMRLRRGLYDVSAVAPANTPCPPDMVCIQCEPPKLCPAAGPSAAVIMPCLQGDTQRVRVRRHRFTHVELHVTNVCIV